ncbi:MAG: TerB family tellurite resistance protein [Commensalibacter sp.]|nr:TerB family tellurite resistance protein [Commensalibacter sp.]
MPVFGKIFGTIAGFATSGPLGALLGAAIGHAADKNKLLNPPLGGWVEQWKHKISPDLVGASTYIAVQMASNAGKKEQVMALCLIILSAKLAKCDGPVNRSEVDYFKHHLHIPPQQEKQIGMLFDRARSRVDDYPKFAKILKHNFQEEKGKLENVFILLYMLARSDLKKSEPLHPLEEKYLRHIQHIFGLSERVWDYAVQGGSPRSVSDEPDAYVILGVDPKTDTETIRNRWRELVRIYHPDLIAAKGGNPQEIEKANQKIVKINAAWDYIKHNRGI